MRRLCLACGRRSATTLPEYPAVCDACLDRQGREPIRVGDRVLCHPDLNDPTIRTVERVIDGGFRVVAEDGTITLARPLLIRVKRGPGRAARR
jgi:hypothetical protein